MPEITIYDSQGNPVSEGQRGTNERIRDFFFDGIRLSMDTSGDTVEIVCFFRARETEAGRSEQYYAVFNAPNIQEASRFGEVVESRVEDELGLLLDTSTDDSAIFEMLRSEESPSNPLSWREVDDIISLIDTGTRATIGTSTYREAIGVLQEFVKERKRGRYAIAENADSSHLSHYDLVVEKGSYDGVGILEETRTKIEEKKRRRQQERQKSIEQDTSHSRGKLLRAGAAVFVLVGGIGVLAIICSNIPVPVLGSFLGCDFGLVADQGQLNDSSTTPTATNTPELETPTPTATGTSGTETPIEPQEESRLLQVERIKPSNGSETVETGEEIQFEIDVSVPDDELKLLEWRVDGVRKDADYDSTAGKFLTWNKSFDEPGNVTVTARVENHSNANDSTSWNITVESTEVTTQNGSESTDRIDPLEMSLNVITTYV